MSGMLLVSVPTGRRRCGKKGRKKAGREWAMVCAIEKPFYIVVQLSLLFGGAL
jgi:hypothetical protein